MGPRGPIAERGSAIIIPRFKYQQRMAGYLTYPELPRVYAEQVEFHTDLRIMYAMLEGRRKPIDLYKDCVQMIKNGYVVDFNTNIDDLKYHHYRFVDAKRSGKKCSFKQVRFSPY